MTTPLQIVIADDSAAICKAIEFALSNFLVSIRVISGIEPLKDMIKSRSEYQLLIVDAHLSGDNATAMEQIVATVANQHPVVVLVGTFEKAPDWRAPAGAVFLKKPFHPEALQSACAQVGCRLIAKGASSAKSPDQLISSSEPTPLVPEIEGMKEVIEQAVWKYCQQHFKAIAKEAISSEINRLVEERSRQWQETT